VSWTKTYTNIPCGNIDHLPPPASFASIYEQEQWNAAIQAAILMVKSKTSGSGNFTITLSGTGTKGHPSGDTISVSVAAP